jgi:hypothetical protein
MGPCNAPSYIFFTWVRSASSEEAWCEWKQMVWRALAALLAGPRGQEKVSSMPSR